MKRRADGRFQKRVTMPDGTYKMLYSRAANERLATKDFNEQLLRIEEKEKDGLLFPAVADEWNTEYRKRISEINYRKNTRAAYNRTVKFFKGYSINAITAPDINRFFTVLAAQKFGRKTVACHHGILNMIFKHAILQGYINYNVVNDVPIPHSLPQKRRELPSDEELKIVNSHYTGFDFLPFFLLNTGLRISEALALEVDKDIDFDRKLITVNKHLLHDGNRAIIEHKTKTESSERTVILLDRVAEKIPKRKGLLFCNEDGSPLTKKLLQYRWKSYQKRYCLTLTAHQLRHGYATMLFEAGIDEKDAQELMGHSDITTTRAIYTHIRNKRKEETAKKLNAFQFL